MIPYFSYGDSSYLPRSLTSLLEPSQVGSIFILNIKFTWNLVAFVIHYTFVQLQRYIQKLSAWKRLDWCNLIPWERERDVQMHRSVKPHICTLNMHITHIHNSKSKRMSSIAKRQIDMSLKLNHKKRKMWTMLKRLDPTDCYQLKWLHYTRDESAHILWLRGIN